MLQESSIKRGLRGDKKNNTIVDIPIICYKNPLLKEDWEYFQIGLLFGILLPISLQESSIKRGLRDSSLLV